MIRNVPPFKGNIQKQVAPRAEHGKLQKRVSKDKILTNITDS